MLVVDNLHFAYKDTRILNGLYLNANEGELVGIVGPNGAGKSTLLRLISGVLKAASGCVSVNGTDLASLKPAQRARLVSVVPQNPQLPLHFKLLDLVLMGRNPHLRLLEWEGGRDLEISRKAMELTDTWRLADRLVGSLSGGERQRGLVAMALAQEAPVLLLDEPTSSLDLAHQTSIMDLVRDVQRQRGGTIVVAMHDLTLAAQYSDRLIMLAEGRSYAEGNPQSVLTRENILRVYEANVLVLDHPLGGTPVILPISNERHMGNNLNGQQRGQQ